MLLGTIHLAMSNTALTILLSLMPSSLQIKHIFFKIYRCSARLTGSTVGDMLRHCSFCSKTSERTCLQPSHTYKESFSIRKP